MSARRLCTHEARNARGGGGRARMRAGACLVAALLRVDQALVLVAP